MASLAVILRSKDFESFLLASQALTAARTDGYSATCFVTGWAVEGLKPGSMDGAETQIAMKYGHDSFVPQVIANDLQDVPALLKALAEDGVTFYACELWCNLVDVDLRDCGDWIEGQLSFEDYFQHHIASSEKNLTF